MMDLFQLLCSQDIIWWTGVMFLSAVWTLILTAPIHYRGSTCEQMMEFLQICSSSQILDGLRARTLPVNFHFKWNALKSQVDRACGMHSKHHMTCSTEPKEHFLETPTVLSRTTSVQVWRLWWGPNPPQKKSPRGRRLNTEILSCFFSILQNSSTSNASIEK